MTEDRATAQRFMAALWAGDLTTCGAMMSVDAEWHFQLGDASSAACRGRIWPAREGLQRIVDDLFGKFDPDGFVVTLTRVIGDCGDIAIEYEARGRTARGDDYHNYYATIVSIAAGQVTQVRPYNDTRHMAALLGNGA